MKTIHNNFGRPKTLFYLKEKNYKSSLTDEEMESIKHVINVTNNLNWNEFIKLVYSTFPILTSDKYSYLDLIRKANEYQSIRK